MTLAELSGKRLAILGFGREGRAVLEALQHAKISADITILDAKDLPADGLPRGVTMGDGYLSGLSAFDVIIKSPGIPPKPELAAVRDRITSGTQIFLDSLEGTGATVIGITGSKGKSTTTSLLHAILVAAGKDAHLVGNIGVPALSKLHLARDGALFVCEMSSYQLMDLTRSPSIAVITSFFPEHLDYHGSIEAYLDAKKGITRFQQFDDLVFFQANSPGAAAIAAEGQGRKIPFSEEDAPVAIEETKLLGAHNLSNIAGAFSVASELGIPRAIAVETIKGFQGLPHRLQNVGEVGGITWVDDAISTTPESAIAALHALGDRVATIILGGQDRGNDFTQLGEEIAASSVRTVLLFPGSGPRIRAALEAAGADVTFHDAATMDDAVRLAREHTQKGAICLLSTASPSYNMFKNFEEKGEVFQRCIFSAHA